MESKNLSIGANDDTDDDADEAEMLLTLGPAMIFSTFETCYKYLNLQDLLRISQFLRPAMNSTDMARSKEV